MKLVFIDTRSGKVAKPDDYAHEIWVRDELIITCLNQFSLQEDGKIILTDNSHNYTYAPKYIKLCRIGLNRKEQVIELNLFKNHHFSWDQKQFKNLTQLANAIDNGWLSDQQDLEHDEAVTLMIILDRQ